MVSEASLINQNPLSEVVNNNNTTTKTDVVHAGIASIIHIKVAKMKIAKTLCSIKVSPSIPKEVVGKNQRTNVVVIAINNLINFRIKPLSVAFFFLLVYLL